MAAALASWRWLWSFFGAAVLSALAWFFGPFFPALQSWIARLAVVLGIFAVWGGVNLFLDWRRRRREAALAEGVAAATPDPSARAASEEAEALREKMRDALSLLRKARGSKGYLYEEPWYAIIGPPGAGKTTALLNAGLRFPLAAEMGQGAVAGVGGTRLCDWWFTEDAVLIDTAGRYTTQDSDAAVDRAGWEAFLDLLKRTRQRQPLNGIIVAIAIPDIAGAPRETRLAHARAVRRRIKEIEDRLAVRLPVYALFTKADLVVGFTEFFDDLDRERRAQVWGATFPLTESLAGPASGFAGEFAALIERLNERLFDRLQAERSPERRALIAGFPAQVASLEDGLGEFLGEAFGGSRLDPAPMLRGFYLTSGTQEGTPIDRLTSFLARSFGIDQRRAPSLTPERGRSYFLARLVKEVVFGEAMLVSERPGAARRRVLLRAGAFAAIGLVLIAGGALLWHANAVAREHLAKMQKALAVYDKTAARLPLDPVADGDLPRVLPLLDEARVLPYGYDETAGARSWLPGLSQERKLGAGARLIYRDALQRVLLPRLLWRLEAEMRGHLDRPDFLYEATRVYLMLGGLGPLDPALVRAWMGADWQSRYPEALQAPLRRDLARHLDALLENPLPPRSPSPGSIALDGALVAKARAIISSVALASRVYSRIRPSAAAEKLPPWRPSDALGAAGSRLFGRTSGKPLSAGIPGFYTVKGFYGVLLPALPEAAKEAASESWVLGKSAALDPQSPEVKGLERDVIARYERHYEERWDAMLADLDLVPWRSPQEGVQDLYVLASPQSPMRALLASIARELTLTKPPGNGAAKTPAAGGKAPASEHPGLRHLFAPAAGAAPEPPGTKIDERYRALRAFVGSGPGAPLDQLLQAMNALRRQLAQLANRVPGAPPPAPTGEDPVLLLRAQMAAAPPPVNRWIGAMVARAAATQRGSVSADVHAAYHAVGGPARLCRRAVAGRYPFTPGAGNDIPLDDFAKLFSPSGLLNGFFNTALGPYVDTSGGVWRGRTVEGVPAPASAAALQEFERAARIRDAFFSAGGNRPSVRFDLTPESLDSGASQVTLELGGKTIRYAHGPPLATAIVWPGPSGMANARLVFDPPPAGGTGIIQASGPWALFRLIDQGRLEEKGSPDRYLLTFTLGARRASFELRAGSVLNPLVPGLLRGFACPPL
jgi:type VI secretion system protein ImpL